MDNWWPLIVLPCSVLLADERHKHLGVHMSKIDDLRMKKLHVLEEMEWHQGSLLMG